MENDLNTFEMKDNLNYFPNGRQPKEIMQPKTFKSQNNGFGTALGHLVKLIHRLGGFIFKYNIYNTTQNLKSQNPGMLAHYRKVHL